MKKPTSRLLIAVAISSLLAACGSVDVDTDGASAGSSTGATSTSTGPMSLTWPKRIVLKTKEIGTPSDGVLFADGTTVMGDGDLTLYSSKMLSISSPTAESVCEKGKFDALGDVPTDVGGCPAALSGTWEKFAYLSATTTHTTEESYVIGLGLLLWNADHTVMYRARVVGDSYDTAGQATATLDYEPAP
jgi:hypothetical protein